MDKERILRKVIITVATTGAAHTPSISDFLPIAHKQIAADAVKVYEAGAAIAYPRLESRNRQAEFQPECLSGNSDRYILFCFVLVNQI